MQWQRRVLIVINHPIFRETVRYLLATDAHFVVVAEANSGEQAVVLAQRLELDLVIMDMRLPGMNGFATAAMIKAHHPQIIILLLSGDWSPAYERKAKAVGVRARLAKQNLSLNHIYRVLS